MNQAFSVGARRMSTATLVCTLALVACGGPTGGPEQELPVVPAASDDWGDIESEVVTPPVQGNVQYSAVDDYSDGDAASLVNVWRFDHRPMSERFIHMHDPGWGASGSVSLKYFAVDAGGRYINLEWPYEGRAVTYRYDDVTVGQSYIAFGEDSLPRDWRVTAGKVAIQPLPGGRVRLELDGLEIAEFLDASEDRREAVADGFVVGDVERVCLEYVVPAGDAAIGSEGEPGLEARRDEDWSSPYCAQFTR
jgi:hypothetical protein